MTALVLVLALLTPAAHAEEPAVPPAAAVPELVQQVQQVPLDHVSLVALGKALGADVPTRASTSPVTAPKTVADVADRVLDAVIPVMTRLEDSIERAAPEVWRVMVRQQYAKAVSELVVPLGIFVSSLILGITYRRWFDVEVEKNRSAAAACHDTYHSEGDVILGSFLPRLAWFAAAVFLLVRLSDSVAILVNPEFYAVRDIVTLLLAPSSM